MTKKEERELLSQLVRLARRARADGRKRDNGSSARAFFVGVSLGYMLSARSLKSRFRRR